MALWSRARLIQSLTMRLSQPDCANLMSSLKFQQKFFLQTLFLEGYGAALMSILESEMPLKYQ
ncbi:hypothetical protein B2J73_21165 [Stutzerimonas stutzeri]|nr:hypothetical protein B2J73_21165 [Stutzerimonas stutzeri]RRV59323.1 hypothetical protein EGJ07_18680 [Stutzerimonas stutzeri]